MIHTYEPSTSYGGLDNQGRETEYSTTNARTETVNIPYYEDGKCSFTVIAEQNGIPMRFQLFFYLAGTFVSSSTDYLSGVTVSYSSLNADSVRVLLFHEEIDLSKVNLVLQIDDNLSWFVDDYINNHEFIEMPPTPFVGNSPLSMWRIDSHINNGMPYVPLMIDLPVLSHNILYGIHQVRKIYYGTQVVRNDYFGTKRID